MARAEVRGTFSQPGPRRPTSAGRLARTLGSAGEAVQCSSRVSALRREPNSHEAAKPHEILLPRLRAQDHRVQGPCGINGAERSNTNDKGQKCCIGPLHCVGISGFQSVCWAAAASNRAQLSSPRRRLEDLAHHVRRRGEGGLCGQAREISRSGQGHRLGQHRTPLMPNPSLKRSTNGRPPGPGRWYSVHFHRPGPGVLPSAPA
ncbi:hypothetical protein RA210_U400006 [Rubrivivax sp. A210]|nr:hypothetical protein RA210_U400006 [Rubrivivax sp. A210]